jgi:hypothetical protein
MTQNEFDMLISDASKKIAGDISWGEDEDHSQAVEFRVEVTAIPQEFKKKRLEI